MYLINQNNNFLNVSKNITNILTIINKLKTVLPSNWSRINKNYLFNIFDNHLIHYNSPINLTYAWSFGSLAGICLIIQMISGIFLGASLKLSIL
jgi:quinol-cytochrome oxidoreductase complex cytochrome b subunit